MEELRLKLSPGELKVINNEPYFRLTDGSFAIGKISNVIFEANVNDDVELIIFSPKFKIWRLNEKFYTQTDHYVTLESNVKFLNLYEIENRNGAYIEYEVFGKHGCLLCNIWNEIRIVFSHTSSNYKKIFYDDGYFFVEYEDSGFSVISSDSKSVVLTSQHELKKVKDHLIFYDDSTVFFKEKNVSVEAKILNVKVVEIRNTLSFIKVSTENGVYYYSNELEFLFGPIKRDKIHNANDDTCVITGENLDKTNAVFYVKENTCIAGPNIFIVEITKIANTILYTAIDANGKKNVYSENFECILSNIELFKFFKSYGGRVSFLGYKNSIPVKYCRGYLLSDDEFRLEKEEKLKFLFTGFPRHIWEKTYVCKRGDCICCITDKGEELFCMRAENCSKKTIVDTDNKKKEIYFLERKNGEVDFFDMYGKLI